MLYRAPSTRSPTYSLIKFLCALALILPFIGSALTGVASQNNDALHFELPANGNLRVENLRGASHRRGLERELRFRLGDRGQREAAAFRP